MTPKEQQLADHILDLALASNHPAAVTEMTQTYVTFKRDLEYLTGPKDVHCPGENEVPQNIKDILNGATTYDLLQAANEVNAKIANTVVTNTYATVDEVMTAIAEACDADEKEAPKEEKKTRKPRTPKAETAAPAAEPEPEPAQEEPADPADDDAEPVKTYAEKVAEAKKMYLDHQNAIVNDTEAASSYKTDVMALIAKHGGQRIKDVPESNMDAFIVALKARIAA